MKVPTARVHIRACANYAQRNPEGFFRACFLAVTSIRLVSDVFWRKLEWQYEVYRQYGLRRLDKQYQFGYKLRTLQELEDLSPELCSLARTGNYVALHERLCGVHGLRAIKAGFITQLSTGRLMCFDSVHCNQRGIDIREFAARWQRKDGPARYRDFIGGLDTDKEWRDWCVITCNRDGLDAEIISESHAHFIGMGITLIPRFFGQLGEPIPVNHKVSISKVQTGNNGLCHIRPLGAPRINDLFRGT